MCQECCCTPQHNEGCGHGRRFLTKAEKIEKLKEYEEELKKEIIALQEHIKELES
ncbi:hypothetical protein MUP38_03280 [Candidatus Bathyarchaeota archaeon]|nr:hypothetical protein [Candidatus Bathyarchaeota archaeon]